MYSGVTIEQQSYDKNQYHDSVTYMGTDTWTFYSLEGMLLMQPPQNQSTII